MKFATFFLLVFSATSAYSQQVTPDSVYQLQAVEVVVNTVFKNKAEQTVSINKEELARFKGHSIADLLQSEGFGFIKTYGAGSIATSSVRGGSAGQMAVFWNDLPIQSPMLGQLDLSILTLGGIDQIELKKGGQSVGLGSGAVAGTIQLKKESPSTGLNVHLRSSIGSFAQQKQNAQLSGGKEKLKFSTRVYKNTAENNFPFQINNDLPTIYMPHASITEAGFQQSLFWKIHPQHHINFFYWQQETDRQIPPTSVQTFSEAEQQDRFSRFAVNYNGQFQNSILKVQLAYFKEDILFINPRSLLEAAASNFNTYITQVSFSKALKKQWHSKTGLQLTFTDAEAKAYRQIKEQYKSALYQILSRSFSKHFDIELGARMALLHKRNDLIGAYHFKLGGIISENIHYHFRLSKDYRIPTLNDLYWIPGGNLDLQTEFSLGQEMGLFYKKNSSENNSWSYKVNVFNRNVDNWIQWTQKEGAGFWSVDNIAVVWSRGVEQCFSSVKKIEKTAIYSKIQLNWIKSTYETNLTKPAVNKGDVLWYTPKWQAFANVKLERPKWSITYNHQWTGNTNGINENLDAYHLGQFSIKHKHLYGENEAQLFVRASNIWNTTYRVIERRPMPGRSFEIGLNLNFNTSH